MSELPKRIKLRRELLGLTQEDVGKHLNLKKATISSYETGNSSPDPDKLLKIANILETSTDYLLGKTENPDVNYNEQTVVYNKQEIKILTAADSTGLSPDELSEILKSEWFHDLAKKLKNK